MPYSHHSQLRYFPILLCSDDVCKSKSFLLLSNLPNASHSDHYSQEAHARLVNMKVEEREILLNISDITQEIEEERLILAEQHFGAPTLLPKREGPKRKEPRREEPRREETSAFCQGCGNKLKPTAKFCGGCGTKV